MLLQRSWFYVFTLPVGGKPKTEPAAKEVKLVHVLQGAKSTPKLLCQRKSYLSIFLDIISLNADSEELSTNAYF